MNHTKSQEMLDALNVGDRIFVRSGVGTTTIIAIITRYPASSSSYAGGTVLHTTGDPFFPFATHTLYFQDEEPSVGWMMTGGQSFRNLTEAVDEVKRVYERVDL